MLLWRALGALGRFALDFLGEAGRAHLFLLQMLLRMFVPPYRGRLLLKHMFFIGNRSLGIVLLTAAFTGMVLVLQGYYALVQFGGAIYLGPLVSLSLVRELGPVLAALMVSAQAGSAIAATVAGMRVSEQIDAMEVIAVDSIHYLGVTRLIAALITMPMLVAIFNLAGIFAAQVFAVHALGLDGHLFMATIQEAVTVADVRVSLLKALLFALFIAWISVYRGYSASQGADGIGKATTQAVVTTAVLILAGDYVVTALLF